MAFPPEIHMAVNEYARKDLPSEQWHEQLFSFLDDPDLASRLAAEFMATRYLYKVLEGLSPKDWLLRAEVKIQILSYASIYEAVLHHILFYTLKEHSEVKKLTEYTDKIRIDIPAAKRDALNKHLEHDGKNIVPTYLGTRRTTEQKVRFDAKSRCAQSLGIITPKLADELCDFYEARNAIHIHAEIRKEISYEIELSKRAYWRMQEFCRQVSTWLATHGYEVKKTL